MVPRFLLWFLYQGFKIFPSWEMIITTFDYQAVFRVSVDLVAFVQDPLIDGQACLFKLLVGGFTGSNFCHFNG